MIGSQNRTDRSQSDACIQGRVAECSVEAFRFSILENVRTHFFSSMSSVFLIEYGIIPLKVGKDRKKNTIYRQSGRYSH